MGHIPVGDLARGLVGVSLHQFGDPERIRCRGELLVFAARQVDVTVPCRIQPAGRRNAQLPPPSHVSGWLLALYELRRLDRDSCGEQGRLDPASRPFPHLREEPRDGAEAGQHRSRVVGYGHLEEDGSAVGALGGHGARKGLYQRVEGGLSRKRSRAPVTAHGKIDEPGPQSP